MEKISISGQGTRKLAGLLAIGAMVEALTPNGQSYSSRLNNMPKMKFDRNVPRFMPKKEQPRNERCKCGSGIKYKKCCGK
jgi:uncharacterized protein YecA (UPF0149 family)